MGATTAAMITAVVGVLGTLLAPVVTTWVTRRQRAQERRLEERKRLLDERRTAYTAMNRASRHFHTMLKDALHRLRDGVYTDDDRVEVEQARRDYRDRYAEAQMVVPEAVLDASRELNAVLSRIDAVAKRIDRGIPRAGETPQQALLDLKAAEPALTAMRHLMREDLGVSD
ncbi:hypothetical protein [Streptomyces alkaliterrae]|uniref:Uncharacterized protein n=1 Tax=Streptomyces alkaliterrae TaxID=2213162 RepID=A0A5P0YXC5_9ACTN|nr:hypothetical protein [Streptomyces alkaliterrae]MBB1259984.1 hypothetical protein [Streptomyces alkaliterrae]MQS04938.1 hypothetical protein [Streptomyces alkaliterrae]